MPIGDFDIALYTLGGVGKMNYDLSWLMHQLHLTKNASNIIGFIFYIIVIIFLQASDAAFYQDWKSVKNEVSALKKRPAFKLPIFAQMACLVVIAICTTTVISSNLHRLLEHVCTNHAWGLNMGHFSEKYHTVCHF